MPPFSLPLFFLTNEKCFFVKKKKRPTISSLRSCKNYYTAFDSFSNVHSSTLSYLILKRILIMPTLPMRKWTLRRKGSLGYTAGTQQFEPRDSHSPTWAQNSFHHFDLCTGSTSTEGSFADKNMPNWINNYTMKGKTGMFISKP